MSLTDEFVRLAPSLHGSGQQRVAESKSGGCESVYHAGVDARVVSVPVFLRKINSHDVTVRPLMLDTGEKTSGSRALSSILIVCPVGFFTRADYECSLADDHVKVSFFAPR